MSIPYQQWREENGEVCRKRDVLLLLKPLQKEDTARSSIDAGDRFASVLRIPVSGGSEIEIWIFDRAGKRIGTSDKVSANP